MSTSIRQQILKDFIQQIWNEGNIDAIPDFISDNYTVMHDPGDPWNGQTLDVEGFKYRVATSRAPVPDQQFTIQQCYENQDSVCITWLWQGTHLDVVAGFKPTGKILKMSGATSYFFAQDKICGHWQIADRLSIFQQLQAYQQG